jgi:hypothetical protein
MATSALDKDHLLVLVHTATYTELKKHKEFLHFLSDIPKKTRLHVQAIHFLLIPASNSTSGMFGFYTVQSGKFIPTFRMSILPPSSVPKTKYYNNSS